jgi:predicted nucleotidyltransferase
LDDRFKISQAYLFGSYAKGHPNRWSDMDLALVSPRFKGIRFYDTKMLIPYIRGFSNFIEVHPFKKEDFSPRDLFVREVIKSGIRIK